MRSPRLRGPLLSLGVRALPTRHGVFDLHVMRNLATRGLVLVASLGDPRGSEALLARVHSSCVTSEALGAVDCDCAGQLDAALGAIAQAGRGALFYLLQEGRGAGFVAKARDRMLVQASGHRLTTFEAYERMGLRHDLRSYAEVGWARDVLGIEAPLALMTNNPEKGEALEREKLPISEVLPISPGASRYSAHYLEAKRATGHRLAESGSHLAELPEPVVSFEPRSLPGMPEAIEMASYLLPVRAAGDDGEVRWLRLHLVCDALGGSELVMLGRSRSFSESSHAEVVGGPAADDEPLLAREHLSGRLGERPSASLAEVRAWVDAGDRGAPWLAFAPAPHGRLEVESSRTRSLHGRARAVERALRSR